MPPESPSASDAAGRSDLSDCAGWRFALNPSRRRLAHAVRQLAVLALLVTILGTSAQAQPLLPETEAVPAQPVATGDTPVSLDELARRVQRLEAQNAELAEQNRALFDQLSRDLDGASMVPPAPSEIGHSALPDDNTATEPSQPLSRFLVGEYDDERGAFVLVRPRDSNSPPFELRLDIYTQVRYSNFSRSANSWTDSAGNRFPIQNLDTVEVNRNFFQFSGYGIDPKLQYTAIIFSSTAINDTVYLGWVNYQFSKAFDLRVGNWLVPGTREWYDSFRYTLGSDRLMATTFFRPNISPGIWLQGEPIDNLRYVVMVSNSLNRFNQGIQGIGSSRAISGSVWWESTDNHGLGISDLEFHHDLSLRLGTSMAASQTKNQGFSEAGFANNPEDTIVRLSDGTPLFRVGALAPGVQLESAHVQLWSIDAAAKYRGIGVSSELFLRWLSNFRSYGGAVPYDSLFDHGGLLQAGYFVVPHKWETFARSSFVSGRFGTGSEFGGGINWYPRSSREWRLTLELLRINNSPAQNLLTGYRAGESGTLLQLQCLTDF